jgi:pimeloyl-ACP methyl ester carboxylesterase
VVGLSMGGRFALDYAVTYPDRPRSLAVIDGVIGGWQWSREWLAAYAPVVEAGRKRDVAQAKSLWLGLPLFAPARQQPEVATRLKLMVDEYSGWHFVNQNPERAVSPAALGRLGAIRAPTLVLVGERDLPDFQRMAERLERDVPGARRATIAGAGHMANMEAPDALNKALAEFLGRG